MDIVSYCPYSHPRLAEAKSAAEDWSGLRSRQDRRKLQTRLNVRAHRKRKAAAAKAASSSSESLVTKSETGLVPAFELTIPSYITADGQWVGATTLTPLSLDHLIPLIQYNVYRATVTNVNLTRLHHLLDNRCSYGYRTSSAWATIPVFPSPFPLFPLPEDTTSMPPSLQPTPLQRSTPHPPWICILPCARMRDNAVRNLHLVDMKDFCADLLPCLNGLEESAEDRGMVVWKDPWDPRGWEVKPGFARKWWFLIRGCTELKEATNYYRSVRGEERLEW